MEAYMLRREKSTKVTQEENSDMFVVLSHELFFTLQDVNFERIPGKMEE